MHTRPSLLPILSLYLAAVLALPGPVSLATAGGTSTTVAAPSKAQLDLAVKLRVKAAEPEGRARLDSTALGELNGLDDDDRDDDSPLVAGLVACSSFHAPSSAMADLGPACSPGVATSRSPKPLHLRC